MRTGLVAAGCGMLLAVAGCGATKSTSKTIAVGNAKSGTTVIVNTPAPAGGGERVYRVPAGSMEPTYRIGTMVRAKLGAPPSVGSVVVFHPPEGAEASECGDPHHPPLQACPTSKAQEDTAITFIKRIVAGPGDSLYIKEGAVYRQAAGTEGYVKASEPYIKPCSPAVDIVCNLTTPITVPAGQWFLLGDNRGESDDSRFWGPVPTAWVLGVVTGAKSRLTSKQG